MCALALGIQNAKSIRRIILLPVGCLALPYFSALSHKVPNVRENKLMNIMCFDFQYNLSDTFLILRRTELDIKKRMLVLM